MRLKQFRRKDLVWVTWTFRYFLILTHVHCLAGGAGVPDMRWSVGASERTLPRRARHRLEVLAWHSARSLGLLPHPQQVECGVRRDVLVLPRHAPARCKWKRL